MWLLDGLETGGAERLALAFAAAAERWPVWLVGLRPPRAPDWRAAWGGAWDRVAERVYWANFGGLRDLRAWWQLAQWLRARQPRLLHAHLRYATCCGGRLARRLGIPLITTVHVEPAAENGRQRLLARWELGERRRAARVIYVTAAQRAAWGRVAGEERSVVIGNGVALRPPGAGERAAARQRLGLDAGATVLLTVAVVRAAKGWRSWLQAAAQVVGAHPEAHFVWVGGGEEWAALRAAAAPLVASGHMRLPGPRSDVGQWLAASDLFLFPSLGEAQPTAVMEAMAAGLPIIATRLGATVEVLGEYGRFVAPGDAAGLAQAAREWMGPQRAAAALAGVAARQRAEREWSQARWCRRLEELYEEVLAG